MCMEVYSLVTLVIKYITGNASGLKYAGINADVMWKSPNEYEKRSSLCHWNRFEASNV